MRVPRRVQGRQLAPRLLLLVPQDDARPLPSPLLLLLLLLPLLLLLLLHDARNFVGVAVRQVATHSKSGAL